MVEIEMFVSFPSQKFFFLIHREGQTKKDKDNRLIILNGNYDDDGDAPT